MQEYSLAIVIVAVCCCFMSGHCYHTKNPDMYSAPQLEEYLLADYHCGCVLRSPHTEVIMRYYSRSNVYFHFVCKWRRMGCVNKLPSSSSSSKENQD